MKWKRLLIRLAFIIRENPYFSAKFFHLIAIKLNYEETMQSGQSKYNEERKSEALSSNKDFQDYDEDKIPVFVHGEMLPMKIRQLIFNMSRYFYRSLFSEDLQKKYIPNYNLLRMMKIWL